MSVLRRRSEFLEIFQGGKKFTGNNFILYVLEGAEGPAQAGFSVSRKVGGAVIRNRQRRRCREILRLNQHRLRPCRQVVVFKPSSADLAYEECRQELVLLWEKSGIATDGPARTGD